MFKIFNAFEDMINLRDEHAAIKDLLKLIFLIIMVAHICGCGFMYIAKLEIAAGVRETWIHSDGLE